MTARSSSRLAGASPSGGRYRESRLVLKTTWGEIVVTARGGRVLSCDLPHVSRTPRGAMAVRSSLVTSVSTEDRRALKAAERFILGILAGRGVAPPPFAWPRGTRFQLRVWKALAGIVRGQVSTYGDLARKIGARAAARAVGSACGANPLPLVIPCHRVVAAGGRLGGFGSGLAWKRMLLDREGACRDRGRKSAVKGQRKMPYDRPRV